MDLDTSVPNSGVSHARALTLVGDQFQSVTFETFGELDRFLTADHGLTWIDFEGRQSAESLRRLGGALGFHPLTVEDLIHGDQRTKLEVYDADVFVFLRPISSWEPGRRVLETEQVAMLLRQGLVVTFQEEAATDVFAEVHERLLRRKHHKIQEAGYLVMHLLDGIIDQQTLVLDDIQAALEEIEVRVLEDFRDVEISSLHLLRRDLIRLVRTAAPVQEIVSKLTRTDTMEEFFSPELRPYMLDCLDHATRSVERLRSYRDFASSLMDLYLSLVGFRTNEVMKMLTLVTSIFIPLSFLAGIYGMNFETESPWNLPELGWRYGYPALLAFMALIVVGLLFFFRRKKWL